MPKIKLYASLRNVSGITEAMIPGKSVRDVLEALSGEFPELQRVVFSGEQLRVIIALNGQTLAKETALETLVLDTDQIAIFPPVAGG
jgi:molybdopterin synthase sulfur carrier subunit